MLITVTSAARAASDLVVEFTCRHGAGRGVWAGEAPRPGQEYGVELDFDQTLRIGVNTGATDEVSPRIDASEGQITLIARIEDVSTDDSNTASLRFGNSLILVEHEGALPAAGTWIEIRLPNIKLFDTNY